MNIKIENTFLLVCLFWGSVLAQTEEAGEGEDEPLLGLLDYLLLLAIAAIGYWWFFMRDSDSDKIPEVSPGPQKLVILIPEYF